MGPQAKSAQWPDGISPSTSDQEAQGQALAPGVGVGVCVCPKEVLALEGPSAFPLTPLSMLVAPGPGPREGRSPPKQLPLLPSPPCLGGCFLSSPAEHKSGGSTLASVVSFCRKVWACLPAVVAAALFCRVPGPSPRPSVAQCLCRVRPEATLLPRRRPPGPSWLLAPRPAPSLSLLSWIRF